MSTRFGVPGLMYLIHCAVGSSPDAAGNDVLNTFSVKTATQFIALKKTTKTI